MDKEKQNDPKCSQNPNAQFTRAAEHLRNQRSRCVGMILVTPTSRSPVVGRILVFCEEPYRPTCPNSLRQQ